MRPPKKELLPILDEFLHRLSFPSDPGIIRIPFQDTIQMLQALFVAACGEILLSFKEGPPHRPRSPEERQHRTRKKHRKSGGHQMPLVEENKNRPHTAAKDKAREVRHVRDVHDVHLIQQDAEEQPDEHQANDAIIQHAPKTRKVETGDPHEAKEGIVHPRKSHTATIGKSDLVGRADKGSEDDEDQKLQAPDRSFNCRSEDPQPIEVEKNVENLEMNKCRSDQGPIATLPDILGALIPHLGPIIRNRRAVILTKGPEKTDTGHDRKDGHHR